MTFEDKLKALLITPTSSFVTQTYIDMAINAVSKGKQIALYGAGKWGFLWLNYFCENGVKIDFFIDTGIGGNGVLREGLPVFLPDDATKSNILLFITPSGLNGKSEVRNAFLADMLNKGFKEEEICFIANSHSRVLSIGMPCVKNASKCIDVMYMLQDNVSKCYYNDYLESILKVKPLSAPWLDVKWQYIAPELFELTKSDYFVDCGAYTGDTVLQFAEFYPFLSGISAFEPTDDTFKMLQNSIAKLSIPVRPIKKAVGDECGSAFFDILGNQTANRIVDNDRGVLIEVTTLDTELSEVSPTYIKMDVEGFELAALRGARETIKKNRPILAICLYHKGEDLYEIPLYLRDLLTDYNFFVRKYTGTVFELVLYAVPAERLLS
jgi:methyltransferase, FkbM family